MKKIKSKPVNCSPDDVLGAVLYLAGINCKKFRHDNSDWAEFFYEQKCQFSVLSDLRFRKRTSGLESQQLSQAYQNLVHTGLLGLSSNNLQQPYTTEEMQEFYKKIIPNFTQEENTQLEKIAERFRARFSIST
jgi:hypothetical protein